MELIVKVLTLEEAQRGVSDSGAWVRQDVVGETLESYPKTVCFEVRNAALVDSVRPGECVKVTFYVQSREYNGRWYTHARAVGLQPVSGAGNGGGTAADAIDQV